MLFTQLASSLHLQLVFELTVKLPDPELEEKVRAEEFSVRYGVGSCVILWVRVTVLPAPVVVKVRVAVRALVEVL